MPYRNQNPGPASAPSGVGRRGSAFALVLAFIVAGTLAIWTSSSFVTTRYQQMQSSSYQNAALGALEAVLTRRESRILRLAEVGDPANFERMHDNYGEEYFGGCRIRWKIEPAIIRQAMTTGGDADGDGLADFDPTGQKQYISNPVADIAAAIDDLNQVENDFIYVYRIAGEARYLPDGAPWEPADPSDILARVQSARYVAITKSPVFRFVIFYAQEGPKGDLEFTHSPALNVHGSVQCNGAIYVGGDLTVNDWGTLNPPTARQETRIGPDAAGNPVRINGVDGIFRLDKKTLYSAVNGWVGGTSPITYDPSTGLSTAFYDIDDSTQVVGEKGYRAPYPLPPASAGTVLDATFGGTVINPNRIQDNGSESLATIGAEVTLNGAFDPVSGTYLNDWKGGLFGVATDLSSVSGGAVGTVAANDSRIDLWASDSRKTWPVGHGGQARNRETGGSVLRLPSTMINRAFELQAVRYRDLDGDPSVDEHEFAEPLFVATNGSPTVAIPDYTPGSSSNQPIVEAPTQYLTYALGVNRFFVRMTDTHHPAAYDGTRPSDPAHTYNGWYVTDNPSTGTPANPDPDESVGLVIRERPQPDESYWSVPSPVGEDSFFYMPFAYGKHTRTPIWPLWPIDVAATRTHRANYVIEGGVGYRFGDGDDDTYLNRYDEFWHFDKAADYAVYVDGGRFECRAAMDPGPDGFTVGQYDWDHSGHWRNAKAVDDTYSNWEDLEVGPIEQDGWWDVVSGRQRYPDYYRENWRLYHMQQPERDTTRQGDGLIAKYYNGLNFLGVPAHQRVDFNFRDYGGNDVISGWLEDNYTVRWQGFVQAEESGPHRFVGYANDAIRIWVNGRLVVDHWQEQSAEDRFGIRGEGAADIILEQDEHYPIVVEYLQRDGSSACIPKWLKPSADWSDLANAVAIPKARCSPMLDTAFRTREIDSVTMRITDVLADGMEPSVAPYSRQKVGLMIRGQGIAGISNLAAAGGDYVVDLSSGNFAGLVSDQSSPAGTVSYPAAGTVALQENAWPTYHIDYTVTANTELTFELYGVGIPEMVGIALQEGTSSFEVSPPRGFYCYGDQDIGDAYVYNDYKGIAYDTTQMATWQEYTIPIGSHYTGTFSYLVLGLDEDAARGGFEARFRNVRLKERDTASADAASLVQVPHLLDGRDPYLALCYSPDRGVFTQFRAERAQTRANQEISYFIGSKGGQPGFIAPGDPNNVVMNDTLGETPLPASSVSPPPTPRTVYLWPELIADESTSGNLDNSYKGHDGDTPDEDDMERLVTPDRKTITLNPGATEVPETNFIFYYGSEVRQLTKWQWKYWKRTTDETWRFHLQDRDNPLTQVFNDLENTDSSDFKNPVHFFVNETGGTEDSNVLWYVPEWGSSNKDKDGWKIEPTYLEHTWSVSVDDDVSGEALGDPYISYSDGHTNHPQSSQRGSGTTMARNCVWFFYDHNVRRPGVDGSHSSAPYWPYLEYSIGTTVYRYPDRDGKERPKSEWQWWKGDGYPSPAAIYSDPKINSLVPASTLDELIDVFERHPDVPIGSLSGTITESEAASRDFETNPASNTILLADVGWPHADPAREVPDPAPTMYPDLTTAWDDIVESKLGMAPGSYATTYADGWGDDTGLPKFLCTFQLARQRTLYTDVNPFITRTGTWFTPEVPASLEWPAWSQADPRPTTGAFRPDQWVGSTPPADVVPGPSPQVSQDASTGQWYHGVVPRAGQTSNARIDAPWRDDIPVSLGVDDDVWLRFKRVSGTDLVECQYHIGPAEPAPQESDWTSVTDGSGGPLQIDLRIFGLRSFIGPCLQSGDQYEPTTLKFADLSIDFTIDQPAGSVAAKADPVDVLDKDDWEKADTTGATYTTKYLCSQYQVFWGSYDITEAFFSYRDADGDLCADEVWITNTREFASQSRWWECGAEKEERRDSSGNAMLPQEFLYPISTQDRTYRELWAKQTHLALDIEAVNNFLKQTDLNEATANAVIGGYDDSAQLSLGSPPVLADRFNGLFVVGRTNRYPWNPNLDLGNQDGHNPWTWPLQVPNQTQPITSISQFVGKDDLAAVLLAETDLLARRALYQRLLYGSATTTYDPAFVDTDRLVDVNTHPLQRIFGGAGGNDDLSNLQPYDLGNAPALRPQDFIHGVRLTDAASWDWGLPNATSGAAIANADAPEFGTSKTLFVTPNQLYLHGDVNTFTYPAITEASSPPVIETKFTPLAVVGDSITMLSNAWRDEIFQEPGLLVNDTEVLGGGSVAIPWTGLPSAESTTFNCSIITHNIPTNRRTVRDGEAASIATVLLFLEDWYSGVQKDMNFTGSLVVMDSRRYSEAYQLDLRKSYGRTPFGVLGWHRGKDFHQDRFNVEDLSATPAYRLSWGGSPSDPSVTFLGQVYYAPNRNFAFNDDLLTSAGTPPFTPFGVTSTGTGAWVNVIK